MAGLGGVYVLYCVKSPSTLSSAAGMQHRIKGSSPSPVNPRATRINHLSRICLPSARDASGARKETHENAIHISTYDGAADRRNIGVVGDLCGTYGAWMVLYQTDRTPPGNVSMSFPLGAIPRCASGHETHLTTCACPNFDLEADRPCFMAIKWCFPRHGTDIASSTIFVRQRGCRRCRRCA